MEALVKLHTLPGNRLLIVGLIAVLCAAIFAIDLNIPLGVAGGVPYLLPVFIASRLPGIKTAIWSAVVCTVLIILGLLYSPEGGEMWQVLENRALAFFVIWTAVWFIIDHKRAAVTLLKSEARLQEVQRVSNLGNWELDLITHKLYWSDDVYSLFNLEPQELDATYEIFQEYVHPDDREFVDKAYIDSIKSKTSYDIIFRLLLKDGTIKFVNSCGKTFYNDVGFAIRSVGTVQDITERRQAEEELLESNERLHGALVASQAGTWRVDLNTGLDTRDASLNRLLGLPAKPSTQPVEDWFTFVHPDDADAMKLAWEKAIKSGLYEVEHRLTRHDGRLLWVYDRGQIVRDDEGHLQYAIGVVMDITERKQTEKALSESEKKYRGLLETAPDGMVIVNAKGEIEIINQQLQKMTGFTPDELIGQPMEVLIPERFKAHKQHRDNFFASPSVRTMGEREGSGAELFVQRKDGSEFPAEISLSPMETADGISVSASIRDITERKKVAEEIHKLSLSVEHSPNIVMITDRDAIIEYVNPMFTEITGFTPEEAIGKKPDFFISEEVTKETYRESRETVYSGKDWYGEFISKKKNGNLYLSAQTVFPIKDNSGSITHVVSFHEDITEEKKLSDQLTYQASHDVLTGLVNRREFGRRAERLLLTVKQDKREHALCFMDLDQFKVVNDTCGHIAGDELLRQLSPVLLNIVRHRDTLARLGGDEFGVLMEHCSLDDALRVATSLQKTIQDYQFSWEGHSFKVGVSMGLVPITETTTNVTNLLKDADAACYMAKDKGRNRIHVYHADDSEIAQRQGEMQWVARLNQALEEDRFCLYAQTIVPLDGSTDKHYELLLRMIDEKGKIIPPGAFLPAAERYNLIIQLDSWVIEKAFTLLASNPVFLKQIHFISINLSGQSLADENLLDFVIKQLDVSGIGGDKICFEITETAAISNLSTASQFISTLKGLGCRFALDDFGSGLSSFAYLKNLSVDYLKIDGMFVKDIVDDPIDRAMVKSINEIGQVMGMQTIAEFVENDEIKGMLREIGVDYAQGYGIGKPYPFDELLDRSINVTKIKS